MRVWATLWAPTTDALVIENSDANGSAGIDHLHMEQLVRPGGVSRAQGYRLLKKAWAQIKDDIDESGIDRQELLSWSIQTLMAAAGQAMQQKNPGAVVACIRQLDHMTGTGYNSHRGHGVRR